MVMQTTHQSASQPLESAPERQKFRIREQELCKTDRAAWVREQLEWPLLGAFYREGQSATRQDPASRLFFTHYLAFFREAELLELPVEGDFLTEWLALAFESAYDLATQNREQAEAWLDEFSSDRQLAERRFRTFRSRSQHPDQAAHDFVKLVVESGQLP